MHTRTRSSRPATSRPATSRPDAPRPGAPLQTALPVTRARALLPLLLAAALTPRAAWAVAPGAGGLVITEILADGACQYNEWFEVYNPGSAAVDLDGCVLSTNAGGSTHTVAGPVPVGPGAYAILYRSSSSCGDVTQVDAEGAIPVAYKYGTLQLSNSELRDLTITCGATVVDVVNFDADEFPCDDGTYGSCSVQLEPATLTAAANDDASTPDGAWCPSSTDDSYNHAFPAVDAPTASLGTPARANTCGDGGVVPGDDGGGDGGTDGGIDTGPIEVPTDVCQPGDFIISELMIAPRDSANADEWIELHGTGGSCNLHSCTLETWTTGEGLRESHQINAPEGLLSVASGEQRVLARATTSDRDAGGISWKDTDGDTITADYLYPYDVYLRSDPGEVRLLCDGELIDSVPIDWDLFSDKVGVCPNGWCSINLHPAYLTATENDDLSKWCVPPVEGNITTHTDPAGVTYEFGSTVRRLNECPVYAWPGEGEAAFVEIIASPQATEEWLEIANVAGRELELTLCTLQRTKREISEETGEEVISDPTRYTFGLDGAKVFVAADAVQLFAKGGCLQSTGGLDTASGALSSDCSYGELFYESLSFTADGDEILELYCPSEGGTEVLVDRIEFNFAKLGVREGHSLMLDAAKVNADAATTNDDPSAWCEAAFGQQFLEADDEKCNYGTPGELGQCLTDPLNPPKTVCRCAGISDHGWRAAWPLLGLPLLVLRRRRTRSA